MAVIGKPSGSSPPAIQASCQGASLGVRSASIKPPATMGVLPLQRRVPHKAALAQVHVARSVDGAPDVLMWTDLLDVAHSQLLPRGQSRRRAMSVSGRRVNASSDQAGCWGCASRQYSLLDGAQAARVAQALQSLIGAVDRGFSLLEVLQYGDDAGGGLGVLRDQIEAALFWRERRSRRSDRRDRSGP